MGPTTAGGSTTTTGGRARGAAKAVLLGLLPLVALLVLAELLLWATGLGDPRERLSLTRGFDDSARYLVADPDVPGGWVTQMYDGAVAEVHVPPKGSRLRVLIFGGSNSQGFPEEYLEAQLNRAAPAPGFEVVNLGRQGYGSERVRILFEQAMALRPDLVFLYCGHNEFVERGFAMELVQEWQQPWVVRMVEGLSRLRTLNVLVSLFEARPDPAVATGPPPERRVPRGASFQDLTYDKTLLFCDEYRHNLQRMLDIAHGHGVQVLLSTVVGNMLVPPLVVGAPPGMTEEDYRRVRKLQAQAVKLIPLRYRAGLLQTDKTDAPIRLDPRDWGETVTAAEHARRLAHPATPPGSALPELRTLAPPFAGGPWWGPPEAWDEKVYALLPTVGAVLRREPSAAERADLERAVATLEQALALVPDDAVTLYDQGLCTWLLGGDDAHARQCLADAARLDHAPTRANDLTNGIVRELAAQHPELHFVDAEEAVAAACPGGVVSYELLMDNCHLYPAVRPPLMDLFVPGLLELGSRVQGAAR